MYGSTAEITGAVGYNENPNEIVKFTMAEGIVISDDVEDNLRLGIFVNGEEKIVMASNMRTRLDMRMEGIVFYAGIKEAVQTQEAKMLVDEIGVANTDATAALQACFDGQFADFNADFENGWSLMNIDPAMAMLGGLIHNITLTPYVSEGWAWAGMYMYADLPTDENPVLEFTQ